MNTTDYTNPTIIDQYASQTLAAVFITYPALLKLLGGVKGKTVLDIGCGAGWLAGKLARRGARVVAVDRSPEWIALCRKQNRPLKNITFLAADAGNLKMCRSQQFDIVTANMVFLNVPSRRKLAAIFKEIGRVLRGGGD